MVDRDDVRARVLVLAETYIQAKLWADGKGLAHSDWWWPPNPDAVRGLSPDGWEVAALTTFADRADAGPILVNLAMGRFKLPPTCVRVEFQRYEVFDIVRGPDGQVYAANLDAPTGPPPGDGWIPWAR